jgi:hypothetical protein
MTAADPRAAALLARIDQVEERLRRQAGSPSAGGLTDPDPPTGERWDYGQVWAHLGEFVPYWTEQVRLVMSASREQPVPFGRVKSDPGRVAAIERDRGLPADELMDRLSRQLEDLRTLVRSLSTADWGREGLHPTLGAMDLPGIFQEFLVGHLESHVGQLDGLRSHGATPEAP